MAAANSRQYIFIPMKNKFQFIPTAHDSALHAMHSQWRNQLSAPQDGMWESLTEASNHWVIEAYEKPIGYVSINEDSCLLQSFLIPEWLDQQEEVLSDCISLLGVKQASVGTNDPLTLSMALHAQKSVRLHSYLFEDCLKVEPEKKEGTIVLASVNSIDSLVTFYHKSTGAPEAWLHYYLGDLIQKGELFYLEQQHEIAGSFEVRKRKTFPQVADIGMVVSPNHRRQGLGTFLLGQAKATAIEWEKAPICSCEKENLGSLKAIHNNGFRSVHQMLLIEF